MSVALLAFTACTPKEEYESADVGLNIKAFFPTKVVTGQPMTINGSGFNDVKEIVFPGGVSVSDFEHVGNDMIRVNAPSGISAEGGPIKVRTNEDEVESRVLLTVGNTVVSGFSKQAGEEINGGEQLSIFGTDLEFISRVELLDTDGNPLVLEDEDFYRKGTSLVTITIPKKTIFDGAFVGYVYTIDGKVFPLPELTYIPVSDGGHWETVETVIWENDGSHGAVSWSNEYRFAGEGFSTGEEIAIIPADVWEKMKSETFYITVQSENPQIRITTGWWSVTLTPDDFMPGNELLVDNGDGTWTLAVNLADNPDLLAVLDVQHMLVTGDRFTPLKIFFLEEQWIDGGGHEEIVRTSIWKNDGSHGAVSWSSEYRFAGEGFSTGEEIAIIPADVWEKMKSETFYITVQSENPQIRITTGWWSVTLTPDDFMPGNELLVDNGDGTWTLAVNLADNPDLLAALDVQHMLITGDRFTPLELYFEETIWVDGGGDDGPKETDFWKNDGDAVISWSSLYRFCLEGHDTNPAGKECLAEFPQDVWDKVKTGTFYIQLKPTADWFNVRVTTGWWDPNWNGGDIGANDERMVANEDGTYHIELNLTGDQAFVDAIDDRHILFTGEGYIPLRLYFVN